MYRTWLNTSLNLAYSFTRADALIDGSGFINNTNWQRVLSIQGNNNAQVIRSIFDAGSRLTAFVSHKFDYSDKASTTFSAFYTAQSGSPYSYIYSNPIAEISQSAGTADLIYVPASQGDINLVDIPGGASASAQWSALDNFISNNDYLNSRRGDYAEANKLRTPFENVIDIKITQDFYLDDIVKPISCKPFLNLLQKYPC